MRGETSLAFLWEAKCASPTVSLNIHGEREIAGYLSPSLSLMAPGGHDLHREVFQITGYCLEEHF